LSFVESSAAGFPYLYSPVQDFLFAADWVPSGTAVGWAGVKVLQQAILTIVSCVGFTFLPLVESSAELLKNGLEELVERSAAGYPNLTILCRVPFLQLVESSVELLKDAQEELVDRSAEGYAHFTILCKVPFLQLVESSVELLKDGLEELVERSAEDYPNLTILCRVPFLQLVESSVELLKDGLEELVEQSAAGYPHLNLLIREALFKQVWCTSVLHQRPKSILPQVTLSSIHTFFTAEGLI
jgi:hypothetical protein